MIPATPLSPLTGGIAEPSKIWKVGNSVYSSPEESAVDIEHEKEMVKIDYEKMKKQVANLHAHKKEGESYSYKDVLFKFKIGQHKLFSSSTNSDLDQFGVGIALYFKFLKHLIRFFFVFLLLSIPAYVFYIAAYSQYYVSTSSATYLNALTSTTLGSIGLGSKTCSLGRHPDYGTADQSKLHLSCIKGNIADVSNINFGFVPLGSQCDFILQDDIDTQCNNYDLTNLKPAFSDCDGNPSCEITISKNLFIAKESSTYCDEIYQYKMVYMQVTCISRSVEVDAEAPYLKSKIAYIVTTLDAVIVIMFLFMIISLKYAQKSAVKNVLRETYSASSYSLIINNLPKKSSHQEVCAELWQILKNKLGQDTEQILDVQVIPPYKLIEYIRLLEHIKKTKGQYIHRFVEHCGVDFNNNLKQLKRCDLQAILSNLQEKNHPELKKLQKYMNAIEKLSIKQKNLKTKIAMLENDPFPNLDTAFVTFNDVQARNKILEMCTPPSRFPKIFGSSNKSWLNQNDIIAQPVDEPSAIIWENLETPKNTVRLRRGISLLCTILLWVISALFIILSTYYQNEKSSKYPSINCSNYNPTKAQASTDYNLGDYMAGLIVCYCDADISSRKYEVFADVNNEQLCLEWYKNEIAIQVLSWAIVVIIIVMNFIVELALFALSQFEKHTSLTKKISERAVKIFIGKFLNTGLIILFINIKSSISWWQGQYNDLSPLWYSQVGSTLVSTMLISAFSGPGGQITKIVTKKTFQWFDRKFGKNPAITRKTNQTDYEEVYTGPEFALDTRYSQILTVIFVCFLYGSGMPVLYLTTFIQLTVTYFLDKYYLLKFSKLPESYGSNLETIIRRTLYAAIILHLLIAIFIFGESNLFVDGITVVSSGSTVDSIQTNAASNSENVVAKFFTRAGYKYNILFVVLLLLTIIFYLVKIGFHFFPNLKIVRRFQKIFPSKINSEKTDTNSPSFLEVLKLSELDILIKTTQKDIATIKDEKLLACLQQRLQLLEKTYVQASEDKGPQLSGFFSYDFRVIPSFSLLP